MAWFWLFLGFSAGQPLAAQVRTLLTFTVSTGDFDWQSVVWPKVVIMDFLKYANND